MSAVKPSLPSIKELLNMPAEDKKLSWVVSNVSSYNLKTNTEGKKKRQRTSQEQLQALSALFAQNPLPTAKQRQELAAQVGMTPRGVQVWFQNKRQTIKRMQRPVSPVSERSDEDNLDIAASALLDLSYPRTPSP
ncbi:hypothetical protein HDV06_004867 [Boothiomyces sp. JEL0866]|nr:hypothetical protein HDV06_004867 [Boothiomyces sp. JEL0866]